MGTKHVVLFIAGAVALVWSLTVGTAVGQLAVGDDWDGTGLQAVSPQGKVDTRPAWQNRFPAGGVREVQPQGRVETEDARNRRADAADCAALQRRLLDLAWKIGEARAAANRIVTSPVIEGRVDVIPSLVPNLDDKSKNPSSESRSPRPGPTVYDKDANRRLAELHAQAAHLKKQCEDIEGKLRAARCSIPRLPECDACHGAGIRRGPHYEPVRDPEDGRIRMTVVTSGLSVCWKCKGSGLLKPAEPQDATRREKTPSGHNAPAPPNEEPAVFGSVDALCDQVGKYNNKPVSVTGFVARVHADSNRVDLQDRLPDFTGTRVDLGSRKWASCAFKEQDKAAVLALQPGQRITVVGTVEANQPGGFDVFVMEKCVLKR